MDAYKDDRSLVVSVKKEPAEEPENDRGRNKSRNGSSLGLVIKMHVYLITYNNDAEKIKGFFLVYSKDYRVFHMYMHVHFMQQNTTQGRLHFTGTRCF